MLRKTVANDGLNKSVNKPMSGRHQGSGTTIPAFTALRFFFLYVSVLYWYGSWNSSFKILPIEYVI